ncbi:MAG: TolC family protein [Bacteroidota bacterium]
MRSLSILFLFLNCITLTTAQSFLDQYIDSALESNISLQQKSLSFERSLAALEEAKAMFFPKVSLEARFSVARGGRNFAFPVGDLLNPVYDNLNLLNSLNQATVPDYPTIDAFPKVENQQEPFLRETDQETTLRLTMPVFNAAILKNRQIKQDMVGIEQMSVEAYKRELVKEVKSGYYSYLKANQAVELFEQTLRLVKENLRTSQSLYKNHKVTIDVVYAAEAEVKNIEQQLAEVEKNLQTSQAYFNFLLNRDYQETIRKEAIQIDPNTVLSVDAARNQAFQQREELRQLDQYYQLAGRKKDLEKSTALPQVNLVADYGIQGTSYAIGREDDFFMGSLVMSWNLFDRTKSSRVQQASIDQRMLIKQKEEIHQQIGLSVVNAFYDLRAAEKQIAFADKEVESSQKAYKLVAKKFAQGQENLVALTNARTQKTNAELKSIIAKYDREIKAAALERNMASYTFK